MGADSRGGEGVGDQISIKMRDRTMEMFELSPTHVEKDLKILRSGVVILLCCLVIYVM